MRARAAVILLILVAALAAAAPAAMAADRDRNRVADDLQARLATASEHSLAVIVRLTGEPTDARLSALARAAGRFRAGPRLRIIDGFAARLTPAQISVLARAPGVVRVDRDAPVHAFNDAARSSFGVAQARAQSPGLDGNHDGAPDSYSPADLVAAVIDTGIDAGHVDLDGGKVLAFTDLVNGAGTPYDDDVDGHGTHVAATIAGDGSASGGTYAGVAPRAGLVGVKVLDSNGTGSDSTVIAGVQWAVDHRVQYGIEALNLSLGSDDCSDGADPLSSAVDAAVASGLVVAAAAGNAGPATCTVGSPGAAAAVITVGAMADLSVGGFSLADFSSRGPTFDGRVKPDVLGPGVTIRSALAGSSNGYHDLSGTSMATPFVTGLALLMRDARPSLSPGAIKAAMVRTAIDWGAAGADGDYGFGRLDGHAALRAAGAALGSPPSMPAHKSFPTSFALLGGRRDYALDIRSISWPIAVTVIRTGGLLAGLDATLLDPGGAAVGNVSIFGRQGVLSHKPTRTGVYTLRLTAALGGSLLADVSAGLPAPRPTAIPAPTPVLAALQPVVTGAARAASRALRKLGRRKLRRRGGFSFKATVPLAGKLLVRIVARGKNKPTLAQGSHTFPKAGTARIKVKLTRKGRRYLKRHRKPKLTVRVSFTDTHKRHALARRKTKLKP